MKKTFIAIAVVAGAGGLIYALTYKPAALTTTMPSTPSMVSAGAYKDGTYTSTTIQVEYGPIQVSAAVAGGKITNVTMLQNPYDHPRSRQVADYATPILIKEAIAAQSANVDVVSGATETSQGFIEALQSALDQAKS